MNKRTGRKWHDKIVKAGATITCVMKNDDNQIDEWLEGEITSNTKIFNLQSILTYFHKSNFRNKNYRNSHCCYNFKDTYILSWKIFTFQFPISNLVYQLQSLPHLCSVTWLCVFYKYFHCFLLCSLELIYHLNAKKASG